MTKIVYTDADIELMARKIIMSAYLYYYADENILPDVEYDSLSRIVAMNWDQLIPLRQFQLGDPDALKASGYHIIQNYASEGGARSWYFYKKGLNLSRPPIPYDEWTFSHKFQIHCVSSSGTKIKLDDSHKDKRQTT